MATKFSILVALGALLVGANASAASLSLVANPPTSLTNPAVLAPGQSVLTVTVQGSGFGAGTTGGDFNLAFTGSALQFVSGVPSFWFDTAVFTSGGQPATLGSSSPIRADFFRSFPGDVGSGGALFDIATFTFNVLPGFSGSTTLQLSSSLVGWFDPTGSDPYTVTYGNLQVVPAPPAIWLLATAVGGLAARRFRQKAAA